MFKTVPHAAAGIPQRRVFESPRRVFDSPRRVFDLRSMKMVVRQASRWPLADQVATFYPLPRGDSLWRDALPIFRGGEESAAMAASARWRRSVKLCVADAIC